MKHIVLIIVAFASLNTLAQKKNQKQVPKKVQTQLQDTTYNTNAMLETAKMYQCFVDTDYVCFKNYMLPDLCDYILKVAKVDIIELTKTEMKNIEGLTFTNNKITRVVQSVKTKTGYQKIIESLLEMNIGGNLSTSLSYSIAFSNDGTTWKFMRISNGSQQSLCEIFPIIDKRLKLPENQNFLGKSMVDVGTKYKIKYKTN
jgi:hypothetical protein